MADGRVGASEASHCWAPERGRELNLLSVECEAAKSALETKLGADWVAMVVRQAQHTAFAGEMRYTFTCQNGRTVEQPLGVTY